MSGSIALIAAIVFPLGNFFYSTGKDIGEALYGEGIYVILCSFAGLAAGIILGCALSWLAISITRKEDKAASDVMQNALRSLEEKLRTEFNEKLNALIPDFQANNFSVSINEDKKREPEESPEAAELINAEAEKERRNNFDKAARTTAAASGALAGAASGAQAGGIAGFFAGPVGIGIGAVIGGIAGLAGAFLLGRNSDDE